ncbi:unnamed protein product [Prorocentrum cordatum]|uniref:Uncharacterized protein n=1 Tax=Prorocentrum cordatum TaxID=2364126 RepID=A0ABN9WEY0_9DINO|nr:unnamed protein product [Polarella glacialis]
MDGSYLIGEAPGLRNYFVAAGMNSSGIASAGGAGYHVAEWVARGTPANHLWSVDVRRVHGFMTNQRYLGERAGESLGDHYRMIAPKHERSTARGVRRSPLFGALAARGARFGQKAGWERPNYFCPSGPSEAGPFVGPGLQPGTWGEAAWMGPAAAEHRACRSEAAVFDTSSFAKLLVVGDDAAACLSALCANEIRGRAGFATYTQMLNERGGIEADVTVREVAPGQWLLLTGTDKGVRDKAWIESLAGGRSVRVLDVTSIWAPPEVASALGGSGFPANYLLIGGSSSPAINWTPSLNHRSFVAWAAGHPWGHAWPVYSVLALMGPLSPQVLARAAGLSGEEARAALGGWKPNEARELDLGLARGVAVRTSYVGERQGWELHVEADVADHVYQALHEAAAAPPALPLRDAGYHAIDSLRIEAGRLAWRHELTPDETPLEAGLGFAVRLGKEGGFLGEQALASQKAQGVRQRCCLWAVGGDAAPFVWGGEPILADGAYTGQNVTSGARVPAAAEGLRTLAMGYVAADEAGILDEAWLSRRRFEVEVGNQRYPAVPRLLPARTCRK